MLSPEGEVSYWRNTANPVSDASGKIFICLETGHNITEQKKAESELLDSQQFATSLMENAPNPIMVINPDTSIRYVNPAWERSNGWTRKEVVGMMPPHPWWPDEQREAAFTGFMEALCQPFGQGETEVINRNGEHSWIDMNWTWATRDGERQYLIINSSDITERKKAEAKRQAILETAIDGFWICDRDGRFLEVNDAYCTMTGYTREELLKMSIRDIEACEKPSQTTHRIQKIHERLRPLRVAAPAQGRAGHHIAISVKYDYGDEATLRLRAGYHRR